MIRKSGSRFSEKIMLHQKKTMIWLSGSHAKAQAVQPSYAWLRSTSANCEMSQRVNQRTVHGIGMRKMAVTATTSARYR
jgi:hypothetical protein